MACRSLLNVSGALPEQGWLRGASKVAGGSRDEHKDEPLVKLWESAEGIQASLGSGERQCGSRAAALVELLCVAWG